MSRRPDDAIGRVFDAVEVAITDTPCRWTYANSMSFAFCETHSDYHRSFSTPPTVCPAAAAQRSRATTDSARDSWARGDWMQTYTGRRFYPLDPRAHEIDPEDIAHALSLLCRYGGHVDRFYSVAEHCVLMSLAVEPEAALAALLHDATEAYVCDVPRPLKRQLAGYAAIEARVWAAIAARFTIPLELPAEVHDADNRILLTERAALMARAETDWPTLEGLEPLPVTIHAWRPAEAEQIYLDRLDELLAAR